MNKQLWLASLTLCFSSLSSANHPGEHLELSRQAGFLTLQYNDTSSVTTVTGIRDRNITGNFTTGSGGDTGGLLFNNRIEMSASSPYITKTANQSNFPGAVSSTPYGPSFGSPAGILRGVGSYITSASPYDLGYLHDAATGVTTTLQPTSLTSKAIFDTIAHSTFANQVVGNFDTQLNEGKSFIYNIANKTYSTVPLLNSSFNNRQITNVVSNTAYGVYNNLISGGYAGSYGGVSGIYSYIHNQSNGKTYTFSSPDASLVTHFEGITSAGKAGIYNLVADAVDVAGRKVKSYVATVNLNSINPATGQPEITWTEIRVKTHLTSANSMYQGTVIGVYTADGITSAYQADIGKNIISLGGISMPIYNPDLILAPRATTFNAAGNDLVIGSNVSVVGGNGIESGSSCGYLNCAGSTQYGGVITNNGKVNVSGMSGSSAVLMQGAYGTLLNYGAISASTGNYAIKTDGGATGTLVVNTAGGIIDGQVSISAGEYARFENSGFLGITAPGSGVTHAISGTFVQTSSGTLGMRVSPTGADQLIVSGTAKLDGTLNIAADPGKYKPNRYALVSATSGLTGAFSSVTTNLASANRIIYDSKNAYLDIFPFATADVQSALNQNSIALQNVFTLQNTVLVNGFTYDCSIFNSRNICISAGGRNTAVNADSVNSTSGLLIGAYKIDPQMRIGGYIDQNISTQTSGFVKLGNASPMVGVYGVWSERLDGTGSELKISAGYGQKNTTMTRSSINGSEAGSGSSNLVSQGIQMLAKYGLPLGNRAVISPYAGLRYTQNNMGAYTETTSGVVTVPLSYDALNTNATTVVAGLGANYKASENLGLLGSIGLENDLNTNNGTYAVSGLNGLNSLSFNPNPVRTRATASAGAYYDLAKAHRVALNYIYRQEPYQGINTNSVFLTYTMGM